MGAFDVEPQQVPDSTWWRRDTPTVMDGMVVRYTRGKDVRRNEISASRNGVCVKWNGIVSDPGEFVDVLGWAAAQVPVLLATSEPMPLGCEQHPAPQAESEKVRCSVTKSLRNWNQERIAEAPQAEEETV